MASGYRIQKTVKSDQEGLIENLYVPIDQRWGNVLDHKLLFAVFQAFYVGVNISYNVLQANDLQAFDRLLFIAISRDKFLDVVTALASGHLLQVFLWSFAQAFLHPTALYCLKIRNLGHLTHADVFLHGKGHGAEEHGNSDDHGKYLM